MSTVLYAADANAARQSIHGVRDVTVTAIKSKPIRSRAGLLYPFLITYSITERKD